MCACVLEVGHEEEHRAAWGESGVTVMVPQTSYSDALLTQRPDDNDTWLTLVTPTSVLL